MTSYQESIELFKQNVNRHNAFLNDPDGVGFFTTTEGEQVQTIPAQSAALAQALAAIQELDPNTVELAYEAMNARDDAVAAAADVAVDALQVAADAATVAADKAIVQSLAQFITSRNDVRLATQGTLPANTYNNAAGTITFTATGSQSVDGLATVLSDSIVVPGSGVFAGIYTVTTKGASGVAEVWTRRADSDTGAELIGACVRVTAGTAGTEARYRVDQSSITLGTTVISMSMQPGSVATEAVARSNGDTLAGAKQGSLNGLTNVANMALRQTLGGSLAPLTFSQHAGGGIDVTVASTGDQRIYAASTPYLSRYGKLAVEISAQIVTVPVGKNPGIGVGFGGGGAACRHYLYRADGQFYRETDAESATVLLAANSSAAFVDGDTVKLRIEHDAAIGTATATMSKNGSVVQTAKLTAVPTGSVELSFRGQGTWLVQSIFSEGMPQIVADAVAAAAAPELSAGQTAALYAASQMLSLIRVSLPSGWGGWTPDFNIFRSAAGQFFTDLDPNSRKPFAAAQADAVLYVDPVAGLDTNSGSSLAPLKSLRAAIHGRTGNVYVYAKGAAEYDRLTGFADPNPLCTGLVIESWDGQRIRAGMHHAGLSWSNLGGGVYSATIVTVGSVTDLSNPLSQRQTDKFGVANGTCLVRVADQASVVAGTYAVSGTTIYLRTFDSRAPDSSIRVFENKRNFLYNVNSGACWIKDVDFLGGARACQIANTVTPAGSNRAYLVDCTIKYSGQGADQAASTGGYNSLGINGECYVYSFGCEAAQGEADDFNYHNQPGSNPPRAVEIGCVSYRAGRNANGTNDNTTMHDGGTAIRLMGDYGYAQNYNLHDVGNSWSFNLGCSFRGAPVAVKAGVDTDATKIYLYECLLDAAIAIQTEGAGATVYTRNCDITGSVAGANVVAF